MILEGTLFGVATQNEGCFISSAKAPGNKPLSSWKLINFVAVARDLDLFSDEVFKRSIQLVENRNKVAHLRPDPRQAPYKPNASDVNEALDDLGKAVEEMSQNQGKLHKSMD